MSKKETFYAKLSEYYDKIFPLSKGAERFILQEISHSEISHSEHSRLLDIGCGTGSLSIALANAYALSSTSSPQSTKVTALDLDDEMIHKANEKNSLSGNPVNFRVLNMLDIESVFGCESFDTIICLGNTIVHLLKTEEIELFFNAAASVLVPGGKLILQGLNYNYILNDTITALPLIVNGDIQFIRNYKHSDQNDLLEFKTEIRIKEAASVSSSTFHNPLRPEMLQTLIKKAGFSNLQLFGGFDRSVLTPKSLPLVITCIKD